MDEKVEYFVAYEKEHFENISTKHKDQMKNIINNSKEASYKYNSSR